MYLSAELRMGKYSGKGAEKKVEEVRKLFPEMYKTGNLDTVEVKFEVGYWRKANQIHKWFVDNCQDGKDECQDSYVSREDLEKLRNTCKKVLKILSEQKMVKTKFKDKHNQDHDEPIYQDTEEIEKILSTSGGFFFGGTEYDEYYKSDIENTIKIINKCLKLPEEWSFEYHSSW